MEARNRRVPEWFHRLSTGQLMLPRFQRLESWSRREIETLLDTVMRGRPIGAALVLAIGDKEPFISRKIEGAPERIERTTEHLLDGQQRLTALWKALTDGYEDRTYFAVLNPRTGNSPRVTSWARWMRNESRRPLWADQPKPVFERGWVPMRLLNPTVDSSEINTWCELAIPKTIDERWALGNCINELRTAVREVNLPFLELPVGTPPDDAIDVFVKMNTSYVRLSSYDIVVAQVEAATNESLRDLEGALRSAVPDVERYVDVPDLVLRVAALREDRAPTITSFLRLDFERLANEWEAIQQGIDGAIGFLQQERIFDGDRLPTIPVVQVLASLWSLIPQTLDGHGQARTLLRSYLWRSFFTDRYERATNTAALQDYRGLKARLVGGQQEGPIPIFNDELHPVADVRELLNAAWPRSRNTLARAILAVSLRAGGIDFADGIPADSTSIPKREYHHLFPDALLRQDGKMVDREIHRALNCAVVTWNSNRSFAAKEPIAYLRERVERAPLGEQQIRNRVASHIIPYDKINVGGYADIECEDARAEQIRSDYERFLEARAEMMHKKIVRLCRGEED